MFSCCRPLISNPSNTSPGYGATITVNLIYAVENGGATPQPISRVVLISDNGITHSTHFDQRSVWLSKDPGIQFVLLCETECARYARVEQYLRPH